VRVLARDVVGDSSKGAHVARLLGHAP
jgi:hypothetical protein